MISFSLCLYKIPLYFTILYYIEGKQVKCFLVIFLHLLGDYFENKKPPVGCRCDKAGRHTGGSG